MLEYLCNNVKELNIYQKQFIDKIKDITIHFLYETPTEPINTTKLINELTSLNTIIKHFNVVLEKPKTKTKRRIIKKGTKKLRRLQKN
jgi:hypothetical protein